MGLQVSLGQRPNVGNRRWELSLVASKADRAPIAEPYTESILNQHSASLVTYHCLGTPPVPVSVVLVCRYH
jgi:hypothetical protein